MKTQGIITTRRKRMKISNNICHCVSVFHNTDFAERLLLTGKNVFFFNCSNSCQHYLVGLTVFQYYLSIHKLCKLHYLFNIVIHDLFKITDPLREMMKTLDPIFRKMHIHTKLCPKLLVIHRLQINNSISMNVQELLISLNICIFLKYYVSYNMYIFCNSLGLRLVYRRNHTNVIYYKLSLQEIKAI